MTAEILPVPTGPVPSTPGAPTPSTPGAPTPSTPGAPTPSTPGAPTPAARACRQVCDGVATGLRFVGTGAAFVVLLAVLAGLTGLLGALWFLVFRFAAAECDDWDNATDCTACKIPANVGVAAICVVCGIFATAGLYCLRKKKIMYAPAEPVCDALRTNTTAFLWCGISAVWALQYIVLFVVRSAFLACLIPFLHLAVAAVVYPIDYYVGTRIYPDSTS